MFLNPLLLFGALGVSVPIVIHLLNRRRFVRVTWAAMRFIQASLEKNRRRMQIEDFLLLLVRCLIVAILAVALARPTLRHVAGFFGRQPVTAVVLLDNSYSMGKSDGVTTRFAMAQQAADEVVASLPSGSSAAVLLVSDVVRDVIPQPASDLNLLREKLRQAPLSDRSTQLLPGLKQAYKTLASAVGAEKRVYLITDMQAYGWHRGGPAGTAEGGVGGSEIARLIEENKESASTHVIFIPDPETANLSLSMVRLMTELPTVNKPLRFEVEVSNHGDTEVRNVPVRLFVDEDADAVEEAAVDVIAARSSKSVSLHARLRSPGYHGITARIGGGAGREGKSAADHLPVDDARSLVVRVLKQVQVLLVDGEAGREGREEDQYFVRESLQPVPVDLRPGYFIQTRTIPAAELPQTSLDGFDAVILANVADLPPATLAALERLVGEGRGLIVFPGPNTNVAFYSDVLYRQQGLLPAAIGEATGDSGQGEHFETLQSSRFEHPIMSIWNEEGRGSPAVAHFFRMFDLKIDVSASAPAATNPAAGEMLRGRTAIVASFANGNPAIAEHTFGQGRVVLFASTANTEWNDLPVRAAVFIPLMHRVLDSLLQRQDEHLSVQVGEKFVLRCGSELLGHEAKITRPGGTRAAGVVDVARVEMVGNWPELVYDQTESSGVYQVAIDGAAPDSEGGGIKFAAQLEPGESDLQELSRDEVAAIARSAGVIIYKAGAVMAADGVVTDAGRELWRPLAWSVLVLAAMETLMAFWFSRVK